MPRPAAALVGLALELAVAGGARAAVYELKVTPQTVVWGRYDTSAKPALTVRSGDTVVVHTVLTNSPSGLEKAGVKPGDVEPALREVYAHVPPEERGPGGHVLTGPIYVEGAEPGDMLEVRFDRIDLAIPYSYNAFRYGAGLLTDDFLSPRIKIVPLDARTMTAAFAPGVSVPLHPFFGSVGTAPPPETGRLDSAPPTPLNGGNLDNKALVAGTTLYLPVNVPGALLEIGDGHAAQGDGEVDITALETSLTGRLTLRVRKDLKVKTPYAETPTGYILMGFDDDLAHATRKAVRAAVDFLVQEKGLSREDAYQLASVAGDLSISEIVDRNKEVSMTIPKGIFTPLLQR